MSDNELIAEFMGGIRRDITNQYYLQGREKCHVYDMPDKSCLQPPHYGEYKTSWNELMSVAEKIESLGGIVGIDKYGCRVQFDNYPEDGNHLNLLGASGKIKSVYASIVEFIKWYNSQPKP